MKIQIKTGLEIGDNCPPFVIAEVGSNWESLDDCLLSIGMAKDCGADAVKFQAFDAASLYGPGSHLQGAELHTLNLEWLPDLKAQANLCGIEFMCSAFSSELIDAVDPFVNIHKLASAEMCHVRMLEKFAKIGKPLFMSTGAHSIDEIRQSLRILGQHTTPIVLMYCVAAYPAQEIDFGVMCDMRAQFSTLVGFSDHTQDIAFIPREAYRIYGASVIEKHVNFMPYIDTPDSAHSLSQDQFRQMVHSIRGERRASIGPVPEELPMINRYNRRLIATKDIKIGEHLREGNNFGIYRALQDAHGALSPFKINEVEGKQAKREIKVGEGICEGDF